MKHTSYKIIAGSTLFLFATMCSTVVNENVFADAGTTTLSGAACATPVSAQAYDIDFGTYLASDVYQNEKNNQGTKGPGGAGIQRLPSSLSGNADFYVYASNPCGKQEWVIQVDASAMTSMTPGAPTIPDTKLIFSGATHVFRFNNSPVNDQMLYFPKVNADHSSARTVMSHGGINNGVAGDYGVLLTHAINIPVATPAATYTGTFTVSCVGC